MSLEERVAVVETQAERLIQEMDLHRKEHTVDRDFLLKHIDEKHKEVMEEIAPIRADWQKYKGAIGMAVLLVSMLWTGILFFKENIISWFK